MDEVMYARFERTYGQYAAMLYRIARLSVCRKAEAEDCVAETFLALMTKAPVFASDEREKAWLIRVCINTCKNFNKRAFNRKTTDLTEILPYAEQGFGTVETRDLLERLPVKAHLALYLKFYEGLTSDEIGRALGIRAGGVRSLLSRACKTLRLDLDDIQEESI